MSNESEKEKRPLTPEEREGLARIWAYVQTFLGSSAVVEQVARALERGRQGRVWRGVASDDGPTLAVEDLDDARNCIVTIRTCLAVLVRNVTRRLEPEPQEPGPKGEM
jgi:hypothetical protein